MQSEAIKDERAWALHVTSRFRTRKESVHPVAKTWAKKGVEPEPQRNYHCKELGNGQASIPLTHPELAQKRINTEECDCEDEGDLRSGSFLRESSNQFVLSELLRSP